MFMVAWHSGSRGGVA